MNCPFKNCNSFGHINGKNCQHLTASACPNYYNTTNNDWSEMVYREEGKRRHSDNNACTSNILLHEPNLLGISSCNSLYQYRRAQQCVVADPVNFDLINVTNVLLRCMKFYNILI